MRITKYLHSCLLIEEQGTTILIDPGQFTYEAKVLDLKKIKQLDYLLITHEHFDHFFPPFIQEIKEKFPHAKIISNSSVVELLKKENIQAACIGNEFIQTTTIAHERLWDREPPQNTVFTLFNRLTHPGDSLHFTTKAEIVALPLQAPWGSTTEAIDKALSLHPKFILPIHDWQWKDEVRKGMYGRLEEFSLKMGIVFKSLETGVTIEL